MLKLSAFLSCLLLSLQAMANPACVVCTVAIGASLSLARYFGVDDCVVGVWTGAMLAIIGYWTIRLCEKKGWDFKFRTPILMTLSVAMVGFMYMSQLTYTPVIIGFLYIDSFLLTNIVGAITLIASINLYAWMKENNGGHAHFPFEKVVVPLVCVFLVSLIFHYFPICNCEATDALTPIL